MWIYWSWTLFPRVPLMHRWTRLVSCGSTGAEVPRIWYISPNKHPSVSPAFFKLPTKNIHNEKKKCTALQVGYGVNMLFASLLDKGPKWYLKAKGPFGLLIDELVTQFSFEGKSKRIINSARGLSSNPYLRINQIQITFLTLLLRN